MSDREVLEEAWSDMDEIRELATEARVSLEDGDIGGAFESIDAIHSIAKLWEDQP